MKKQDAVFEGGRQTSAEVSQTWRIRAEPCDVMSIFGDGHGPIGNQREGCVAPLNQNQNKNTLSVFGVRPCLQRLHRCLLAPPQAAGGDVSER